MPCEDDGGHPGGPRRCRRVRPVPHAIVQRRDRERASIVSHRRARARTLIDALVTGGSALPRPRAVWAWRRGDYVIRRRTGSEDGVFWRKVLRYWRLTPDAGQLDASLPASPRGLRGVRRGPRSLTCFCATQAAAFRSRRPRCSNVCATGEVRLLCKPGAFGDRFAYQLNYVERRLRGCGGSLRRAGGRRPSSRSPSSPDTLAGPRAVRAWCASHSAHHPSARSERLPPIERGGSSVSAPTRRAEQARSRRDAFVESVVAQFDVRIDSELLEQ